MTYTDLNTKQRAYNKRWREKNRDATIEATKRWRNKNPQISFCIDFARYMKLTRLASAEDRSVADIVRRTLVQMLDALPADPYAEVAAAVANQAPVEGPRETRMPPALGAPYGPTVENLTETAIRAAITKAGGDPSRDPDFDVPKPTCAICGDTGYTRALGFNNEEIVLDCDCRKAAVTTSTPTALPTFQRFAIDPSAPAAIHFYHPESDSYLSIAAGEVAAFKETSDGALCTEVDEIPEGATRTSTNHGRISHPAENAQNLPKDSVTPAKRWSYKDFKAQARK